ncbi:protein adenylyltransferase SelO [Desulfopila aestuarii]|uniref:Protein nucleotidyltransferase YdiU n=1 Tax=Desulfopila aestuarii DSM 18488 TaxID=1121416 RepID=A0A1M7YBF3_9BACT|nr:YdiU family protein [Desulfopila aestuarii]SHO49984.1 Uncharacterized conserved protein YdiU, UPF0061 family [Desulfopila aestuarii DSM 18488]
MTQHIHSLSSLDSLHFDNTFVRELPGDPRADNTRRQVAGACYSRVLPTRVAEPQLIAYSHEMAELLDLDKESCLSPAFTGIFSGNTLLSAMDPFAMCYGGHQFGNWAGQLGDGRAINLGEVINRLGQRWVLQLKGAGPTPYSRRADGLAVLRSSIREFLCSEAMHHLGVPTTRALSLVLTGEGVMRDMFYDGHPAEEPGAIVCRVSPSFIRFGNFEIFASRGEHDVLRKLVDYTIRTDFPHLEADSPEVYFDWFAEICSRTAAMIVHWMRVGFVHGVMNTDNMSILGLTIDYGPYGWIDNYDPDWTPNTTDANGHRYAFGKQPYIALWNLTQLANALHPLTDNAERLQAILDTSYRQEFLAGWRKTMAAKLGLTAYIEDHDETLITELLDLLCAVETDMTIFFRQLAKLDPAGQNAPASQLPEQLIPAYYNADALTDDYQASMNSWLIKYRARLVRDAQNPAERRMLMNRTNPKYVLRNYMAQIAIEKAECGDYSRIHELLELLRHPYDEQPENEKFFMKRPDWARHKAGCSMLS